MRGTRLAKASLGHAMEIPTRAFPFAPLFPPRFFGRVWSRAYNGFMHELAVTESILDIVKRHATQAEAERVLRVNLVIGELSSIVDDSVQFYWDYIAQDTVAQGAQLSFRRLLVEVACQACDHKWHPESADWICPQCGESQARVVVGREFFVDSIEVE